MGALQNHKEIVFVVNIGTYSQYFLHNFYKNTTNAQNLLYKRTFQKIHLICTEQRVNSNGCKVCDR